ncbi:hypothetical protein MPSEU_000946800 [Mayamaea pseudoterrestris]|nr:hypothetical protein MPSEU_000946800 [Mayamaea pseudoterrestris]
MIRAVSRVRIVRGLAARPCLSNLQFDGERNDDSPSTPSSATSRLPMIRYKVNLSSVSNHWQQQRLYSSSPIKLNDKESNDAMNSDSFTTPSVDETLDKLFQDQQAHNADAWYAASEAASETAVAVAWDPHWYNLADQAIRSVIAFHDATGAQWALSIVGVTVVLRTCLFPIMVMAQRNSSRMAHLQPELTLMKQRYEAIGSPTRQEQLQFGNRMKALFAKYEVKPLRAIAAPLAQFPLFMGMFFGLQKMPTLFPQELASGGMLWFPDLTVPDPYYLLPVASAVTFLAVIELGKEQMMAQNPAQGQTFVNVFRAMSLLMIPFVINFEACMLCYWTSNNLLTMCQTALLRTKNARKFLGIWESPKQVPGHKAESFTEAANKLMKKVQGEPTNDEQRMKQHNQAVEVKKKAKRFGFMKRETRTGITGKRV